MTIHQNAGALALIAAATRRAVAQGAIPPAPEPQGPLTLRDAATRTWAALKDLQARATPHCPTCGGKGWTRQRVEYGLAGEEARACHCTGGANG